MAFEPSARQASKVNHLARLAALGDEALRPELAGQRPSSSAVATSVVHYTSVCSAISSASSASIPRYLTVLSSLVCPSSS